MQWTTKTVYVYLYVQGTYSIFILLTTPSRHDIVVFTNDVKRCELYKTESQNVKNKGYCQYPENYLRYKIAAG